MDDPYLESIQAGAAQRGQEAFQISGGLQNAQNLRVAQGQSVMPRPQGSKGSPFADSIQAAKDLSVRSILGSPDDAGSELASLDEDTKTKLQQLVNDQSVPLSTLETVLDKVKQGRAMAQRQSSFKRQGAKPASTLRMTAGGETTDMSTPAIEGSPSPREQAIADATDQVNPEDMKVLKTAASNPNVSDAMLIQLVNHAKSVKTAAVSKEATRADKDAADQARETAKARKAAASVAVRVIRQNIDTLSTEAKQKLADNHAMDAKYHAKFNAGITDPDVAKYAKASGMDYASDISAYNQNLAIINKNREAILSHKKDLAAFGTTGSEGEIRVDPSTGRRFVYKDGEMQEVEME